MKLRTKLLVSIITATMALSPLSAVFAANHAIKAPKPKPAVTTVKTKTFVKTTTPIKQATYVTATTTTTVKATVYGDVYKAKQYTEQVNQVKALLKVLIANPQNLDAKAQISKLITTKKDIKVIAKAISEVKYTVIQEMKAAIKANDKVAFKTAQQKINSLNVLAKQLKQEIVKQAKLTKQAELKAKIAIQQLNKQKVSLNKALKIKSKIAKTQQALKVVQTKLTNLQQQLTQLQVKQATATQANTITTATLVAK